MRIETLFGIAGVLATIVGWVVFFALYRRRSPDSETSETSLALLQNQLNALTQTLDSRLGESNRAIESHFGRSAGIIRDVTERLTRLDETNRQVVGFADQLQNLQDILKNPKQRGILGEYYLETVLKNVLPPGSYQMQYNLGAGEDGRELVVDAAVFVRTKIIPIDSKFSLENYNRIAETRDPGERERLEKLFVADLKTRIIETSKYIRPDRNTMDFAFMFIPHEAIYYDLLTNKIGAGDDADSLIQRAAAKYRVCIISPTSFHAYLQTVLQGLKALQIEEQAIEIRKRVDELGKHLLAHDEYLKKLGITLGTAVGHYNASYKELKKVDKDVLRITGEAPGIEPFAIDKPEVEA